MNTQYNEIPSKRSIELARQYSAEHQRAQRTALPPLLPEDKSLPKVEEWAQMNREFVQNDEVLPEEVVQKIIAGFLMSGDLKNKYPAGSRFLVTALGISDNAYKLTLDEIDAGKHIKFLQLDERNRVIRGFGQNINPSYVGHLLPKNIQNFVFTVPAYEKPGQYDITPQDRENILREVKPILSKLQILLNQY